MELRGDNGWGCSHVGEKKPHGDGEPATTYFKSSQGMWHSEGILSGLAGITQTVLLDHYLYLAITELQASQVTKGLNRE